MSDARARDRPATPLDDRDLELVLDALAERLEQALGTDPWALGHRAAGLAFAASLVDPTALERIVPRTRSTRLAADVLRRYLRDRADLRGLSVD